MVTTSNTGHGAFDRRAFLARSGLATAGVAALAAGLPRPAAAQDATLAPFLHGVASGEPLTDRVVLWTRVTPATGSTAPIPVQWVIATDLALTNVVGQGTVNAVQATDFTVKVDPTGLQPFTYYYYAFTAGGVQSLIGRTKTAPTAGQAAVDRLRFAVTSCANYEGGYFNAYARIAARNDLDAVFAMGDYVYEYGPGGYGPGEEIGRVTEPPTEMFELSHYRGRYAHYRLDPDLRRAHQLFPWFHTWDDHETTNDSYRDGAENHQPDTEGDYAARKLNAQQAWQEWLPTRVPDPSRIYRTYRYGDLAELVWMDTRIEGRDEPLGGVLQPNIVEGEIDDPEREMISQEQRDFLYPTLTAAQTAGVTWKLLCQQVMMMQWNAGGVPEGLNGTDFPVFSELPITEGGMRVNTDAWDGYPAERARLYTHLRDNDITNIVTLTGDIHTSWAADLTEDPYDIARYDPTGQNPLVTQRNIGVEFVTPSVTSDNVDEIVMEGGGTREMGIAASRALELGTRIDNPHIKMVDLERHGYLVLDITAERAQADWYFTPILEPDDTETFFQAWYADVDTHRVQQGTQLAARDAGPAIPPGQPQGAATPTPTPTVTPAPTPTTTPIPAPTTTPTASLPATGGGAAALGVAAIGAAAAMRRRGRTESAAD